MRIKVLLVSIWMFTFFINGYAQKKWPKVYLEAGNICLNEPYKLVFHDEFEGQTLDTAKWVTYYPYGPQTKPDSCAFCRTHVTANIFRDTNAIVEDGILRLKTDRQEGDWFGKRYNYTSGLVYSNQIFNTYGKYEIRFKLPPGGQQWPAFWVFGWSTEIDIFEFICKGTKKVELSVHKWINEGCPNKNPKKGAPCFSSRSGVVDFGIDFSKDYNTMSLEYDPNMIRYYINGNMIRYIPKYYDKKGYPVTVCNIPAGEYYEDPSFPIHGHPVHVIANQSQCGKHKEKKPVYPNYMDIDFIRVYQKKIQAGLAEINITVP
jgi:beta-glucanase (GH16 family)